MIILSIVSITTGILLVLIGLLIWKKQLVTIIAGYNESNVIDKKGLAQWIGKNLIILGVIVIIMSLGITLTQINTLYILFAIIGALLVMISIMAFGCNRYEKK